jgi:hypothetical protein
VAGKIATVPVHRYAFRRVLVTAHRSRAARKEVIAMKLKTNVKAGLKAERIQEGGNP